MTNGIEVKLQRNALSVIEAPTGNEDDDDLDFDNTQRNGSDMSTFDSLLSSRLCILFFGHKISKPFLTDFSQSCFCDKFFLFQHLRTHLSKEGRDHRGHLTRPRAGLYHLTHNQKALVLLLKTWYAFKILR